jgi:hypothetical protein
MMNSDFDEILSRQDEIVPSSGFVASVMETVQQETAAPAPIPFPWKRALPMFVAMLAALTMLVAGIVELFRAPYAFVSTKTAAFTIGPVLSAADKGHAGWIALALVLAAFSTFFSLQFISGEK